MFKHFVSNQENRKTGTYYFLFGAVLETPLHRTQIDCFYLSHMFVSKATKESTAMNMTCM